MRDTLKGTGAVMGVTLRATTCGMQGDMELAACVAHPPVNKGMPDIPTAP